MKKSTVIFVVLAVVLSSCSFTTLCPTYSKKAAQKPVVKETRI
ncbi:MAG TPA: hypothetical protein VGK59_03875 [Ohtaekwangia sp.]